MIQYEPGVESLPFIVSGLQREQGMSEPVSGYAVIFSNVLREDASGYDEAAERMLALAREQPGFLGVDSVRDETGTGITVSYWESLEAIERWREHPEHAAIRARGRSEWYASYRLTVARIERSRELEA